MGLSQKLINPTKKTLVETRALVAISALIICFGLLLQALQQQLLLLQAFVQLHQQA